jgi:uncharacterized protein (TIGR02145 family)
VRAYALSSAGTAYGNEVSFATVEGGGDIISNPGEGVTFDGYTYASVVLGNGQEWMAENLRTTEYANGDPIPNVSENLQWLSLTSAAWAHYDDSSNYDTPFGKLYNWYAVGDSRNVCPSGWHVPSDEEWGDFINYLDPAAEGGSNWENIAGVKMKSLEQQYWWQSANVATNESGFSGLPGGIRLYNGTFGGFGQDGYWWSSTESSATSSWARVLEHNYDHAIRGSADFDRGLSIRCLKD